MRSRLLLHRIWLGKREAAAMRTFSSPSHTTRYSIVFICRRHRRLSPNADCHSSGRILLEEVLERSQVGHSRPLQCLVYDLCLVNALFIVAARNCLNMCPETRSKRGLRPTFEPRPRLSRMRTGRHIRRGLWPVPCPLAEEVAAAAAHDRWIKRRRCSIRALVSCPFSSAALPPPWTTASLSVHSREGPAPRTSH